MAGGAEHSYGHRRGGGGHEFEPLCGGALFVAAYELVARLLGCGRDAGAADHELGCGKQGGLDFGYSHHWFDAAGFGGDAVFNAGFVGA